MRIAMLTNNYKPFIGGVPISVERLSESLRKLGHEVTVFAPEADGCGDDKFVVRYKILYQQSEKGLVIGQCFDKRIEQCFKERRFDVIHVHHPVLMGQTALYLGKKYGIPVAYTYHTRYEEYLHYFRLYREMDAGFYPLNRAAGYVKKRVVPRCMETFTNQCDLIFAPTGMMKDYLVKQGTRTRISVLPTGLDDSAFERNTERSGQIRAQYLRHGDTWLFATTARLEKEKNLEFLLRGIARLKERAETCFRIMIIGDGTERQNLERLSKQLGIEDQVVFTGKLPNDQVRHYLNAADAFLFASKSETQGIVLLEAMAAGCPVTAVKASGVSDVVKHGVNGYMTEEDENAWAETIEQMMAEKSLYQALSQEAQRTAEGYRANGIAKLAEHQYYKMIERKEEVEYEGMGKSMFMPSILRIFKTA
ncbi:glycosyltransferase [Clostridium sp. MCC353]|nr:glycosyltransferase [Clostridium sp. MCC353]